MSEKGDGGRERNDGCLVGVRYEHGPGGRNEVSEHSEGVKRTVSEHSERRE